MAERLYAWSEGASWGQTAKKLSFAAIDDHSRLIPHAQFYLRENLDRNRNCLIRALEKCGLSRKPYVDHGPAFHSEKLCYACACLGNALVYATPYTPAGKGKVESACKMILVLG